MAKQLNQPCWMYHAEKGKKLFDAATADMAELADQGWVDNPGKLDGTMPDPLNDPDVPATPETKGGSEGASGEDGRSTTKLEGIEAIREVFDAEPTRLTVEELLTLGKHHDVKVKKNWKEATLIKKIREGLNGGDK